MIHRHSLCLVLALSLSCAGPLLSRTRPAPPVSVPSTPVRVASLEVLDIPSNYLPLKDGRVALLDNVEKRLKVLRDGRIEVDVEIQGKGFRGDATNLVDLAEAKSGGLLILDSLGGTVWQVGFDGFATGSFGLFVGATRLARGADGRLYVRDVVNTCVTGFEGTSAVASFPSKLETEPFATAAGRIPFVRRGASGVRTQVGILQDRPQQDAAPRGLEVITPRAGLQLYSTSVVGAGSEELYVAAASWDPDRDQAPRTVDLWIVSTKGERTRRVRAPRLKNHCWDCGPEFRLGPAGDLWFFQVTGGHSHDGEEEPLVYRIYRMDLDGGRR